MEAHNKNAGETEMKMVYRRRIDRENASDFFIKIFTFISGIYEDFNEGFPETKNQDQDDCVGMEAHNKNAGETEMKVVYRRRIDREKASYFDHFCGFFCERISNETPNLQSDRNRKNKRRISGPSDVKVFSPKSHSRGQSGRGRCVKSCLRGRIHDVLFDRYFRNLWRNSPEEKRNRFTYLNCLWFCMYTREHFRKRVLTWIKKENIFSKTYVFVPIVLWSHWYLLILCHFGESLQSQTRTPCVLLLDSLHALDPMRLGPLIRRFVLDIYETEDRPENKELIEKIPLLIPKVPQQRNGEECGIFALYYANLFLESAPDNFSISEGYPYFMKEDWFSEEELEGFYERLESLDIKSSDSE